MPNREFDNSFDLIVCGGGMVGASLVAALLPAAKKLGLRMALVEQSPLKAHPDPQFQPSFDARSTALAYGSRSAFEQMGIWSLLREHLTPIETIHVSDQGRFGQTTMRAEQESVDALGYVVENHWLGQVLMSAVLHGRDQVELFSPATVSSIDLVDGVRSVVISEEGGEQRTLKAPLVVMADGGRSELRQSMGIDYRAKPYHQHALIANVEVDRDHQGVAYERFTEKGPIALLPIESIGATHRMGLVWTQTDDLVESRMSMPDEQFLSELQQAFGHRAGRLVSVGERYSYPLNLVLADEQVRAGLVVLGNAAHSLHPIAGQGFNLALRGVCELAELILKRKQQNLPLGDLASLQGFVSQRQKDQQRTIGFGELALATFSSSNPLLRVGRALALQTLDMVPAGRTLLARAAMGLDTPAVRLTIDD